MKKAISISVGVILMLFAVSSLCIGSDKAKMGGVIRFAIAASFAQNGNNPHKKKVAALRPSLGIARSGCVGAILNRGTNCEGKRNSRNQFDLAVD